MQAKDDKVKELQKHIEVLTVQLEKLSQEKEDLESKCFTLSEDIFVTIAKKIKIGEIGACSFL